MIEISGDIRRIRLLDSEKRPSENNYRSGEEINIKYIGEGEYVGWYLDGNERFLLGDFTVTHNTRFENGKDASEARYTRTRPERIFPYIYRKEDQPILKYLVDEGEDIEPETYYPIIPMQLINGALGIATGYSTFIPNHNPLDCVDWLRAKIMGTEIASYLSLVSRISRNYQSY